MEGTHSRHPWRPSQASHPNTHTQTCRECQRPGLQMAVAARWCQTHQDKWGSQESKGRERGPLSHWRTEVHGRPPRGLRIPRDWPRVTHVHPQIHAHSTWWDVMKHSILHVTNPPTSDGDIHRTPPCNTNALRSPGMSAAQVRVGPRLLPEEGHDKYVLHTMLTRVLLLRRTSSGQRTLNGTGGSYLTFGLWTRPLFIHRSIAERKRGCLGWQLTFKWLRKQNQFFLLNFSVHLCLFPFF